MHSSLDTLLAVLYLLGNAQLLVFACSRWMVRIPDGPGKPFLVVGILLGLSLLIVASLAWVGIEGFAASYLGEAPWPQRLLVPWQWLATAVPLWSVLTRVRDELRPPFREGVSIETQMRPVDLGGLGSGLARRMAKVGSACLEVTHVRLQLPRLPSSWAGLRVAHLSDPHWGAQIVPALMPLVVEELRRFRPDLIACTGDYVSGEEAVGEVAGFAASLAAPLGVYAVLGNHDLWAGAEAIQAALEGAGVTVLRNRGLRLSRNGSSLWLGGVDDFWSRSDDVAGALQGRQPGEFSILLAHNPDHVTEAAQLGVDLQLSGHTHGGQIVFPALGPLVVPSRHGRRFLHGIFRVGGTVMYVSRGIGARLPLRIGSPPELVLLTLEGRTEPNLGPKRDDAARGE